jgi:hypothetical protein
MAAELNNATQTKWLIPRDAKENLPPGNFTVCSPLRHAARDGVAPSSAERPGMHSAFVSILSKRQGVASKSVPAFQRNTLEAVRDQNWTSPQVSHTIGLAELSHSEDEHDAEEIYGSDAFQELNVSFLDLEQMYYRAATTVEDADLARAVEENPATPALKSWYLDSNLKTLLESDEKQSARRVFNDDEPTWAESPAVFSHMSEIVVQDESISECSPLLGSEKDLMNSSDLQHRCLGYANIFGDFFAVETNLSYGDTGEYFQRAYPIPSLSSFEAFEEHALGAS